MNISKSEFTPPTACAVPCSGKPEDCAFGRAVDRLARLPELTPNEIAVEKQVGEWCLIVAEGIRMHRDTATTSSETLNSNIS